MVCNVGDKRNYKNLKSKQQICTAPTGIFKQKSNTRARSNGHCQSRQVFAGGKHFPILTHRCVLHLVPTKMMCPIGHKIQVISSQ